MRLDFNQHKKLIRNARVTDYGLEVGVTPETLPQQVVAWCYADPVRKIVEEVREKKGIPLSGSYEWEKAGEERYLLRLRGGSVEYSKPWTFGSGNPYYGVPSELETSNIVVFYAIVNYPQGVSPAVITTNFFNLYFAQDRTVSLSWKLTGQQETRQLEGALDPGWLLLACGVARASDNSWSLQAAIPGCKTLQKTYGKGNPPTPVSFKVQGDIYVLGFGLSQAATDIGYPGLLGEWESLPLRFANRRQLTGVSVNLDTTGPGFVYMTVTAKNTPLEQGKTTTIEIKNGAKFYPLTGLTGYIFEVKIIIYSPDAVVVVKEVELSFVDSPWFFLELSPPSLAPGSAVKLSLGPEDVAKEYLPRVKISGAPSLEVRKGSQLSQWETAQPVSKAQLSTPLIWGFPGGANLPLGSDDLIEVRGQLYLASDKPELGYDAVGELSLDIGRQQISFSQTTDHDVIQLSRTNLNLPKGWHDFTLRFHPRTSPPKLAVGFPQSGAVDYLGATQLRGENQEVGQDAIAETGAILWEDALLNIEWKEGSLRYACEVIDGRPLFHLTTSGSFASPWLFNPPLRFIGKIGPVEADYGLEPLSDSFYLFLFSHRGHLQCIKGTETLWCTYVGNITGQPALKGELLLVPTAQGLRVVNKRGNVVRQITRTGAYPVSVLPFLGRIYIGWSDFSVSVLGETWTTLKSQGGSAWNHLDVAHTDVPYNRAETQHQDRPHYDTAHQDRQEHGDEPSRRVTHFYYRNGRFEIEDYEDWTEHEDWWGGHWDTPHSDQIHQDAYLHTDTPYQRGPSHGDQTLTQENTADLRLGYGMFPTERGLNHRLLAFNAALALILSEGLDVEKEIQGQGFISYAALNDEAPWPVGQSLAIGHTDGTFLVYFLPADAVSFTLSLPGKVYWIMPLTQGFLVGHKSGISFVGSEGTILWQLDLNDDPVHFPFMDREGNVYLGSKSALYCLDKNFQVVQTIGFNEEVKSFGVYHDGGIYVVSGSELYFFSAQSTRPSLRLHQHPRYPRAGESMWLWAETFDLHDLASLTWEWTGGEPIKGWIQELRPPFAGRFTVYCQATNEQGQASLRRMELSVWPPSAFRTQEAVIFGEIERRVTLLSRGNMVLAFPSLGLEEIYRDEKLRVRVDLGTSISGVTLKFIVKSKDEEGASELLEATLSPIDTTLGIAEVLLEPSQLKESLAPGRYFWAVVASSSGETWTVARGRTEVREGLS